MLESARGLTGMGHFTTGEWKDRGHLLALCGRGVGSHHRRYGGSSPAEIRRLVTCGRCKKIASTL